MFRDFDDPNFETSPIILEDGPRSINAARHIVISCTKLPSLLSVGIALGRAGPASGSPGHDDISNLEMSPETPRNPGLFSTDMVATSYNEINDLTLSVLAMTMSA